MLRVDNNSLAQTNYGRLVLSRRLKNNVVLPEPQHTLINPTYLPATPVTLLQQAKIELLAHEPRWIETNAFIGMQTVLAVGERVEFDEVSFKVDTPGHQEEQHVLFFLGAIISTAALWGPSVFQIRQFCSKSPTSGAI